MLSPVFLRRKKWSQDNPCWNRAFAGRTKSKKAQPRIDADFVDVLLNP